MDLLEALGATAHLTHIEDKLYSEGKAGGEKIFMYLESLFDELKGNTPKNKVRTTLKVDGSPAILMGNNYPNISGPFVGTKMLFSTANPLYYQTPEAIDAKYADIPDLAEKLKAALRLAPQLGIPDGEIWKGDFLFTKKDLVIEEMDGEQYVVFQPNTLIYAVPVNSGIGQKILSSDIGIAFHTKYTGNDLRTAEGTADFDVNVSSLTPPPNAFIIDANLPSIAGSGTMTEEESKAVEELLSRAKYLFDSIPEDFFNTLMTDPLYSPLLNMYENYMVRLASGQSTQFGEDVHEYLMKFTDWISDRYAKEADTKKTEKGKQQTLARGEAIVSFVDQNVSKFISLFELQNNIVKIKNYLLKKMEQVSKLIPLKREGDKLKITNNEGFAVSDIDGDIIKIVDRLGFSQANLLRAREQTLSEKMNATQMSSFLNKHDLSIRKQINKRDGTVVLEVQPETGEDRETAAKRIAFETHLHSWMMKARPVIDDPKIEPYVLWFKDAPGAAKDKRGEATDRTRRQETATAFVFYNYIEEGKMPSKEEVAQVFPDVDDQWYYSFMKSAKALKDWLGGKKGYVYSRGETTYPSTAQGAIHNLIKHMASVMGFKSADSWNPADIYICKASAIPIIYRYFEKVSQQGLSKDDLLQKVNSFLARGLETKDIVGISLKKIAKKKDATVEEAHDSEEQIIPVLSLKDFIIKSQVDTATIKMNSTDGHEYRARLGSNQSGITTLIVEFTKVGAESQLGKATGSPVVGQWFEKYGLHKPGKDDFKEWMTLTPAVRKAFLNRVKLVKRAFPSGTKNLSVEDMDELFAKVVEGGDYNDKRALSIKMQQMVYGELFAKALANDELGALLQDWYLAAKKNEETSAPFVKITDIM